MTPEVEETDGRVVPVGTASSIVLPMPIQTNLIIQRQNAVNDVVRHVLRDNEHYGLIPGTAKKTLLKPGFDILCSTFQLAPDFEEMSGTVERDDFINVVYKCRLTHIPSGKVVASGIGSCNSREEKYRWKRTERQCPDCNKETIRQSKEEYGGGFYCNSKDGGCGHKFKKDDARITSQTVGKVENDNPYNLHNTLIKMAQKRAGVAAIITACGLSNDFTQDMEDFEPSNQQVVTEGEIVEPEPMITNEQKMNLSIVLNDKAVPKPKQKATLLYFASEHLGRPVADVGELTHAEAQDVGKALEKTDGEVLTAFFGEGK